jgi:hypothetical protein
MLSTTIDGCTMVNRHRVMAIANMTYMPMLQIFPGASVILILYRVTGTAVRFSGISEISQANIQFGIQRYLY